MPTVIVWTIVVVQEKSSASRVTHPSTILALGVHLKVPIGAKLRPRA